MNHIFISYSRQDEKIVDDFVKVLRDNGYNIWQDKSGAGTGIPFSTKWFEVIVEALYTAEGAIIFHSDFWDKSVPCSKEYELIRKCDLPFLILETSAVQQSNEDTLEVVKNTFEPILNEQENMVRTKLVSRAYSFKQGVDPYQLIDDIKGVSIRKCIKTFHEVHAMKGSMESHEYEHLDPDMFPYMKKYLLFVQKAMLHRMMGILIGGILVLSAIIFVIAAAIAIPKAMVNQRTLFKSMALSGVIDQASNNDPIYAMEKVCNYNADDLSVSSFFSLNQKALQLESCQLPEMVRLNVDREELTEIGFLNLPEQKSIYDIQAASHLGSVVISNQKTGTAQTLNVPVHLDGYSWNEKGNQLLLWSGSRLFIYDPTGKGALIELDENFQRITKAVFLKDGEKSKILAYTEEGTLLRWINPLPEKKISRSGIEFGIFLNNTEKPTVIYVNDGQIVLNQDNEETTIECEIAGDIQVNGFSLSDDETKLALISSDGVKKRIIVISIATGVIDLVVETPADPTALQFGKDDQFLFASSYGSGLMKIDLVTGNVECSMDELYFHNIARYGNYFVLTDYYGNAILFDSSLQPVGEYGAANYFRVPFADLSVAEQKGYLFGVNRGAGETVGCARYNLVTKKRDLFMVEQTNHVAANTAVTVSPDEEYVAYGYPDGTIRIYETNQMYLSLQFDAIGEAISAIRISGDNSMLYVLGESGNIYTLKIPSLTLNDSLEKMQYNWKCLQQKFIEMGTQYYENLTAQ